MISSLNSWLWYRSYRKLPNVAAIKAQTALVKETLASLVSQPWPKKRYTCIPFLMQLDQLWSCLIGVMLSIPHYSTLDKEMLLSRVLKSFSQLSKLQGQEHWKIGSGESVTWLVSNCDVTAGLLPLRYIFMWQKFYVWLYHNGNQDMFKMLAYIDLRKILTAILWMNLLVFTKQPYSQDTFHIILNVLLQIMRSESWFEKLPIWPRGIYCCFVSYAQIPLERIKKRQKLHISLKFKRVFSSVYGGIEDVLNCL